MCDYVDKNGLGVTFQKSNVTKIYEDYSMVQASESY